MAKKYIVPECPPDSFGRLSDSELDTLSHPFFEAAPERGSVSHSAPARAGCPPTNRGGKVKPVLRTFGGVTRYSQIVLNEKGKLVEIPLRRGNRNAAFIDQISFTIDKRSIVKSSEIEPKSNEEIAVVCSFILSSIFGFGIFVKADHSGGRFYEECWLIGSADANYGRVHLGGQRDTILFELTGTGCQAAEDYWEIRLYEFLEKCDRPKITRVDLAHDFLEGEYTPDQAFIDWQNGGYTTAYRKPVVEKVGVDWLCDTSKGKTLYIGSRQSSRFVRVYEKGKAFGDQSSPWVRAEIELKAKDLIIPLTVLTSAGEYFAGSYPVFEEIANTPERIHATKKQFDMTVERVVFYARQQVGRAINAAKSLYDTLNDTEILEMFRDKSGKLPKRLAPEVYSASYANLNYFHSFENVIDASFNFGSNVATA